MSRANGLSLVVQLARDAEQEGAERLREARARLAAAEAQEQAVQAYVGEYLNRARSGAASSVRGMAEERRFLAQLQRSLDAQVRVLEQQHRQLEAARAHWLALRMKRDALEDVLARRRDAAQREREHLEQLQIDEHAGQRHWGRALDA